MVADWCELPLSRKFWTRVRFALRWLFPKTWRGSIFYIWLKHWCVVSILVPIYGDIRVKLWLFTSVAGLLISPCNQILFSKAWCWVPYALSGGFLLFCQSFLPFYMEMGLNFLFCLILCVEIKSTCIAPPWELSSKYEKDLFFFLDFSFDSILVSDYVLCLAWT